jgi:hypothetical protein
MVLVNVVPSLGWVQVIGWSPDRLIAKGSPSGWPWRYSQTATSRDGGAVLGDL